MKRPTLVLAMEDTTRRTVIKVVLEKVFDGIIECDSAEDALEETTRLLDEGDCVIFFTESDFASGTGEGLFDSLELEEDESKQRLAFILESELEEPREIRDLHFRRVSKKTPLDEVLRVVRTVARLITTPIPKREALA